MCLGCPHSGTTITTRLLANHPDLVHAELAESHVCLKAAGRMSRIFQGWDSRCRQLGKVGWVEKSVSHSFQIPRMLHFRPDAKFVIVLRDGRDVTTSMKARWYAHRNFVELVNLWLYINRAILFYQENNGFHVVQYEQLVRNPVATLSDLCAAIGVEYDASMLDYYDREIPWNGQSGASHTGVIDGHDDHLKLRHWQINPAPVRRQRTLAVRDEGGGQAAV